MTTYAMLSEYALKIDPGFPGPHEKETAQAFARRLFSVLTAAPDDREGKNADAPVIWDEFPEELQDWFNEAARAHKGGSKFPDIADLPATAKEKPAVKGKAKAAAEPAKAEPVKMSASERMKALNAAKKAKKEAEAAGGEVAAEAPKAEKAEKTEKAAKPAEVAKEKPAKEPKGETAGMAIRKRIATHPNDSIEQILEYLASVGRTDIKKVTVATFRTDMRGVLAVLKSLDKLK